MTEQRLDHPVIEPVYKAIDEIIQAEQHLSQALRNLPDLIGDNIELRNEIISYLYWFEEKVKPSSLADVFATNAHWMNKLAGSVALTKTCRACKQSFDLTIKSRSNLKDVQVGRWREHYLCPSCIEKDEAQRAQQNAQYSVTYQAQLTARRAREHDLHTMPYRDYLQTPEWQERRKAAMKRAGFRCQVCNAYGVRLNVHHRTYERRGYEDNRDLIVLCEDCHGIFHDNGTLAVEVTG